MALVIENQKLAPPPAANTGHLSVRPLKAEDESEALQFLAVRPLHTVIMRGWIMESGIASPTNRGTFYGCRDMEGALQGVALIGHATLFETREDAAISLFAQLALACPSFNFVMGEDDRVRKFWKELAQSGQTPRKICYDLLMEQSHAVEVCEPVEDLRPASMYDLDLIVPAHAELVLEETGVNPLETDPEGFRSRCARRIEQGRVWVLINQDGLIFKIDVVASTPETVYIEGVYVHPKKRGMGYGRRCMSQLGRIFLEQSRSICGFVNEEHLAEQMFYTKIGYKLRSRYGKIFL